MVTYDYEMLRETMLRRLYRRVGRRLDGESIWSRNWDVCCILDGCRVDTLQDAWPDRDIEALQSVASTSQTWIAETFQTQQPERDVSDVAYITGNPYAALLDADRFAHFHFEPVTDVAGVETVPPSRLTDAALAAWGQRDRLGINRVIVHYMQPHIPFRSRPEWFSDYQDSETWGSERWRDIDTEIDRDEWLAAYRDNLEWVLDEGVEPLTDACSARVAVTADHGNAAGEWGIYGHPEGMPVPAVRHVPWTTLQADVASDASVGSVPSTTPDAVDVDEQLRALGYQ